jgi:hypothetical protein
VVEERAFGHEQIKDSMQVFGVVQVKGNRLEDSEMRAG